MKMLYTIFDSDCRVLNRTWRMLWNWLLTKLNSWDFWCGIYCLEELGTEKSKVMNCQMYLFTNSEAATRCVLWKKMLLGIS